MKTRLYFLGWALAVVAGAQEPARDPVVLAVQQVLPAVVNISTERVAQRQYRDPFDDIWRQFFGQSRQPEGGGGQSLGSGVVVDEDGWIVTNWHVVRRATKIHAVLNDGTKYEARYVSGDEKNDLALLKIDAPKPLPAVRMTSEAEPLLGETVIAVGNPFGLEQTVTRGIISAKNRRYTTDDNTTFEDILQTDASINPGNSGGPLINTRGELVGINMAILSQAQGIGFAIPARRVSALLAVWFSPEKRAGLWLGLRFGREGNRIVVDNVQPDSPAAQAGIQARDVVTSVDGAMFGDVLAVQRHLLRRKAGDVVQFKLERAGQPQAAAVRLAALPKVSAPDLMWTKFGLRVQPLTAELAAAMGLTVQQGLLVADVQKDSPAAAQGFRRGVVITHVAGEEFQSVDRLAEQLADLKAGDAVNLAVFVSERRGNLVLQQTLSVTLNAR
jgi:S1-C subfamily serine protease